MNIGCVDHFQGKAYSVHDTDVYLALYEKYRSIRPP